MEELMSILAPPATPEATTISGREADRWYPIEEVTVYSTKTPEVVVPERQPPVGGGCGSRGSLYLCNRRENHTGRHAHIWYWKGGAVRAVWGTRAVSAR